MAEGFDTNRFHSPIDTSFICPICFGVLKNPMQCENNEHYFCSCCVMKHLEKVSLSCPTCQEKLTVETLRRAPRVIEDVVSRLKINCDHAARGCDAVVELGALQAHVQDCDFMPVACSNDGCDEVVSKRDVKEHEREFCRFKTTTCDVCGKKMPRNKYGVHSCVLRREMDEVKKDLAEMKATQCEIKESIQRMTSGIEILVENVVNSLNSVVVVVGGVCSNKDENSVEQLNLFNQTWTPLAKLKIARFDHATALFQNKIFVCGGSSSSLDSMNSIEVLDMNSNRPTWKKFSTNLPLKVAGHKCVVHGNRLLIIGGSPEIGKRLDTIYELLLVPPYSAKLLCRMKRKRAFHGVELFNDHVLIAGGDEAGTNVEIFDIARNECVEMPPLPSPVEGMATVRRGDSMLLVGGVHEKGKRSKEIVEYNFKTGQSRVELVIKSERAGCAAFIHRDSLIIIGDVSDEISDEVDCFNFRSRSWKKLSPMFQGRSFASGVVVKKQNF